MAFTVPSHLPRKTAVPDISTQILTKVSEATNKTLLSSLASSWVSELDESIQQTKERIHQRIHEDLPAFDRYLETSTSVQERLRSLSGNVEGLSEALSRPESGLVPSLLKALTAHSSLAQEAADARTQYSSLAYLQQCREKFGSLGKLVDEGRLSEGVESCAGIEKTFMDAPPNISRAAVFQDIQTKFRTVKDRLEEQLTDAYSRAIAVSPSEIVLKPRVQVRQSASTIALPSILASLSATSLTSHLSTLRRDLATHYIDRLLNQPMSITISTEAIPTGPPEYRLAVFPAPPNTEERRSRLENMSTILEFLNTHLFAHLPEYQKTAFPPSLSRPVTTALLNNLLIPSLPSSPDLLPQFLELVRKSVEFEERYVEQMLHDTQDGQIKAWAGGVSNHYEKRRRVDILEKARAVIVAPEDTGETFSVEILVQSERQTTAPPSTVIPVQGDEPVVEDSGDAWGLGEEPAVGEDHKPTAVEGGETDGWGLDDDIDVDEPVNGMNGSSHEPHSPPKPPAALPADEPDPDAAWGWNDDDVGGIADEPIVESAWDDVWGEPPIDAPPPPSSEEPPVPAAVPQVPEPKRATRLEKLAQKSKSSASSPIPSPLPAVTIHAPAPAPGTQTKHRPPPVAKPVATPIVLRESYVVSGRTKQVLVLVEDALREGQQLATSAILPSANGSQSESGTLIVQASATILDLYRSLYPVTMSASLSSSPARSMRFANDALYLSEEVGKIIIRNEGMFQIVRARMIECRDRLKVLGDGWYEDQLDKQEDVLLDVLAEADGFTDTADQERFDECENAVSRLVREIRNVAHGWKAVLNKSKYYSATGSLVDSVLSHIMEDILALDDVPEVESHRLAELCRILNALEGLFVEDVEQPSFVVAYVPSWLKFSYLSELLEASMADLTYLFEEGALVDFDVEELVKLIRALFADTPLRATTINKLMEGHPVNA